MKVSIIIPVFNNLEFLDEALASALSQSLTDTEIILIDNGSTDGSDELCRAYAEKQEKIKFIETTENTGCWDARNRGLDVAESEFIFFLDADDRCAENMLERMVGAAEERDAKLVICGYEPFITGTAGPEKPVFAQELFLEGSESVRRFFLSAFPSSLVGFPTNKLYRADIIKKNNIRFREFRRYEDGFFNIDYCGCADSLLIIPDCLYKYRLSGQTDNLEKHDLSRLRTVEELAAALLEAASAWGIKDFSREELWKFYINEFTGFVENACTAGREGKEERERAFENFRKGPLYDEAAGSLQSVNAYRRTVFRLFDKRRFCVLKLLVRLKLFLKVNFGGCFHRIKRGLKSYD